MKDGVIQKVVLMKTGYGYCVNTTDDESVGIGTNVVGTVEDVFLDTPGFNYSPDDTVLIGDYEFPIITSPEGEVLGVTVSSDIEYNRFPTARFSTATGVGAKVVPIMSFTPQFKKDVNADKRKATPLIGIDNVVDCIGDNRDPVGFVNGIEYSGPYHVMSNGLKMTGATHSGSDSIIYDTIEESLSNPVVSSSSYETPTETPTQTVTETPTPNVNTTPTIVTNPVTPTMDTTTTTDTSTSTETDTSSSGGGGYGGGY